MGICGLNVFPGPGSESSIDRSTGHPTALLWRKSQPKDLQGPQLSPSRPQERSGSSRDLGPLASYSCGRLYFQFLLPSGGLSSTWQLPPRSADVLETSEKPVTLGLSPGRGHCQPHALLPYSKSPPLLPALGPGPGLHFYCHHPHASSTELCRPSRPGLP